MILATLFTIRRAYSSSGNAEGLAANHYCLLKGNTEIRGKSALFKRGNRRRFAVENERTAGLVAAKLNNRLRADSS